MTTKAKQKKMELAKLDANNIAELDGWKEKQTAILKDNPFIEIEDRETYEIAKQRRTALVSARTEIQKQDKHIGSFLSNFRKKTMAIAEDLIAITKPAEDKQQEEVSKYEQILEEKRLEKERAEENRITGIKEKIDMFRSWFSAVIDNMVFETIEEQQKKWHELLEDSEEFDFEEYVVLFDEMIQEKHGQFMDKIAMLEKAEEQRIEQVKKDQEAKINELYVLAIKEIDGATMENGGELDVRVTKILKTDFDFGEFTEEWKKTRDQIVTKVAHKMNDFKQEEERRAKIRREEHQNRINQVREGLLDKVFQMTIDDWDVELEFIENALKQDNPFPDLKEEFEHMVATVQKNLDQKMIMINQQLQDAERKAKKKEEEDKKIFETRVNAIKDLGFHIDEKGWKMVGSFNMSMTLDSITELTEEEWNEYLVKLTADMEEIKKQDAEEKKRQKRLQSDKTRLEGWLNNINDKFHEKELIDGFKNQEIKDLHLEIGNELSFWIAQKLQQIKDF